MKTPVILALAMLCIPISTAHAARWVGPATSCGDILQPQTYKNAVAGLYIEKNNFDNLTPGANVAFQNFGVSSLANSPYAYTSLIAESGLVAGTMPSSGNMALHLTKAPAQPTTFTVQTSELVRSVGFALMGLESASWLSVFGGSGGTQLLGRYFVAAVPQAGLRRWIAVAEDNRIIQKVMLEPTMAEDYAIDDLEIAVHAPEPSMLIAWILVPLFMRRGSHPCFVRSSN